MTTSRSVFVLGLALLLSLGAQGAIASAEGPVASDEAGDDLGRRLYETGVGVDGEPVIAVIESPGHDSPGVELPATALPCGSCHGRDGKGRPEGGASPSDLRWNELTRPWPVTAPTGRSHPPYDERKLIRAVTLGFDPAGNRLETAMPRYRLSRADANALLQYLKSLGDPAAPTGVFDDRVEIGVLVTSTPDTAQRASLAVLDAWQAQINGAGGVFGRSLELPRYVPGTGLQPGPQPEVLAWIALPGVVPSPLDEAPIFQTGAAPGACPTCLALPTRALPANPSRRWQQLSSHYALPRDELSAQLRTLAVAEILTAVLEHAGRRLDAESLRVALQSEQGFTTSVGEVRFPRASVF